LGAPGLHRVKKKVRWEPRRTILPPDIFDRFAQLSFWRDGRGTKAHRITQPDAPVHRSGNGAAGNVRPADQRPPETETVEGAPGGA
jgi:hypothetical protein